MTIQIETAASLPRMSWGRHLPPRVEGFTADGRPIHEEGVLGKVYHFANSDALWYVFELPSKFGSAK